MSRSTSPATAGRAYINLSALQRESAQNRFFRFILALLALVVVISRIPLATEQQFGIDLDIPIAASERWLRGEEIYSERYLALTRGAELPYLYPPYLLPIFALLGAIPSGLLHVGWAAGLAGAAIAALRRLGIPWLWVIPTLLWPPILEGIWVGNVQLLAFACFVYALWERPEGAWQPRSRSLGDPARNLYRPALAAIGVGAAKASQVHVWLAYLRERPRVAAMALTTFLGAVLVTLPVVPVEHWAAWLEQAQRAADPAWQHVGAAVSRYVGLEGSAIVAAITLVLAVTVKGDDKPYWLGPTMIVSAANVHAHAWIYLLPAMVVVRHEISLLAAVFTSAYVFDWYWLSWVVVIGTLIASRRFPPLREQGTADGGLAHRKL